MRKLSSCEVRRQSAIAPTAKDLRIRSISRSSHRVDAGSSWSGALVIFSPYICVMSTQKGRISYTLGGTESTTADANEKYPGLAMDS